MIFFELAKLIYNECFYKMIITTLSGTVNLVDGL